MKSPILLRTSIPFFHDKSPVEFQQDSYERFDPMVIRQCALHLVDKLWGSYPLQEILNFAEPHLPKTESTANILEIGCSIGRWIATIAKNHPKANCWGIDYSYQMLKQANDYWVNEKAIYLDLGKQGVTKIMELPGHGLKNLHFGLAKAAHLPFENESQDLILHSFLFDRLEDPKKAMQEMQRILAPGGKMVFVSPLNFKEKKHWQDFQPPIKIYQLLAGLGFEVLDWKEEMIIKEPLDVRGNAIHWNCVGGVVRK